MSKYNEDEFEHETCECPDCLGSGEKDEEKCERCGGAGEVFL